MAGTCEEPVARAISIQGQVERLTKDLPSWTPVILDEAFCPGDQLRVGRYSRASLTLNDDTLLRLAENSSVSINAPDEDGSTWLDLLEGVAHFISRVRQDFQVNTPYINAGVEGTEFTVETGSERAAVTVLEGRVRAANAYGEVILTGGQKAVAFAQQAPHIEQVVDPLNAVQWTLYYPPLTENGSAMDRQSIKAYRQGDMAGALAALAQNAEVERNPPLLVYRASLQLRVGGVETAQHDLQQALDIDPNNAEALALLSIITTVQNQRRHALDLAKRAVAGNPRGLAPLLALSYARQAMFQLPAALEAARQATEAVPDSALAWSQLARLHLMFHHLDEATEAARRAVAIAPARSQPLTTLGFVHLVRLDTDAARRTFEQAIRLDRSAAPLPRFGLGLVEIRKGHLAEGRRQLEISANLDPGNAMIRSYLGKAYYEEKRNRRAETQFTLAKQFDENDPTAWFYNAILLQSQNRPNKALTELQSAIELNDNRAVYRSRFLLDQDEAARDASQARVYQDLGFEQLARSEAYKSLQTSAQNHSAHRLLADSYSGQPLLEKARMSELLQSQLLQPLNSNPIQPQLVASGLGILDGAGPSASGYAEYTPLFTHNGLDLQLNAIGGSNDIVGDDLILSGLHDRIAFSLGQFHYQTDGWRENNDLKNNLYDAFLQIALTPATSIQFEYRRQVKQSGDLLFTFYPDDLDDAYRADLNRRISRIGLHHQFDSNGHFIASVIEQNLLEKYEEYVWEYYPDYPTANSGTNPATDEYSYIDTGDGASRTQELQFIQPFLKHTFIFGGGRYQENYSYSTVEYDHLLTYLVPYPPYYYEYPMPSPQFPTIHFDPRFKNLYLYGQFVLPARINLTLGVTHEDFETSVLKVNETNPKFGLTWEATKNLIFRASYLEGVTRPEHMEQTIEPTQVAGFNQLFSLEPQSDVEQFGLGVDAKLSTTLSVGAEFVHRDIELANLWISPSGCCAFYQSIDQKLSRAYLHWSASDRLSLSIAYEREAYTGTLYDPPESLSTQLSPISLSYHWPSGIYLLTKGTYIDQEITLCCQEDRSNFWNFDAVLGYRFPNRLGKAEIIVKNLLDEKFNYYDLDFHNEIFSEPRFQPKRQLFARIVINF